MFDDLECKAHIFSKRTYSTKAVSKACQTFHSRQKRLKKCHSRILKSFSRFTIIFVKAQEVGVFPLCAKSFLWVSFPSVVLKRKDINIFLSILYPLPKNLRAKIHFCVYGKMLPNRKRRSKTNDLLLLSLLQLLMSRNSWFQRTIFDH